MLITVIGQSGSGKTTWVKKHYYKPDMILRAKPVKHTHNNSYMLIGDYTAHSRTLGTDTISYSALNQIIDLIRTSHWLYSNVIAEGDRITNKKFFRALQALKIDFEVHYFICSHQTSVTRLRAVGSKQGESFMKMTQTKSRNLVGWLAENGVKCIIHDSDMEHETN